MLKTRAAMGPGDDRTPDRSLALDETSSVMGWVAKHRRPACIGDLHQPPWANIYRPLNPARDMRSELAVPLLGSGGGLEGVLNVESPRLDAFNTETTSTCSKALATQAVIAIQEAKLLDTIEGSQRAPESIHAPDELFGVLIETGRRFCSNVDQVALWEIDRAAAHRAGTR